jgi:xylulokinase
MNTPWTCCAAENKLPRVPAANRDLHVVGIDIGTTNTKAVLARLPAAAPSDSAAGSVRSLARASTPTPGEADALVDAVFALMRRLLDGCPHAPVAVGVASMAETGVPLDARSRPLSPLVTWDASRGDADAHALARQYGEDALFAATGVRVSPKVPLVAWLAQRRASPGTWTAMQRWAGVADLVCLALTGRLATDHTLAGRTMAYRLPAAGEQPAEHFDPDLLAIVGLGPEQLPDVCSPSLPAGRTLRAATDRSGLPAGIPVVVAGHDHQVGAHAAGARMPGDRVDSVGTAEAVLRVVDARPRPDRVREAGMSVVRTVGGKYDAVLAGSSAAGALFAAWLDVHGLSGREAELLERARRLDAGPTGILVLPYLRGRQCPDPDADACLQTIGARAEDSPEQLLKAVFEGLCLHTRWMLAAQDDLAGAPPTAGTPVSLLGGTGATTGLWREVKEQVLPVRLQAVEEAEPVATGAALVAAERSGLVDPGVLSLPSGAAASGHTDPYLDTFHRFVAYARTRSGVASNDTPNPMLRGAR